MCVRCDLRVFVCVFWCVNCVVLKIFVCGVCCVRLYVFFFCGVSLCVRV